MIKASFIMAFPFEDNSIEKNLNKKIRFSVVLLVLVFLLIFGRLAFLQIAKGRRYSELSTNNRIRISKTLAPRGKIISRAGDVLVKNVPSFDLTIVPQDIPDMRKALRNVSGLLHEDLSVLEKRVQKKAGRPPFEPVTLHKELSWNEMSLVLSRRIELQGASIAVVPKRLYCLANVASHVFGYLGEVTRSDMQKHKDLKYDVGDMAGKYGLEKWGEKFLRGKKGGRQTEVDVFGNRQKILAEIPPVPGCDFVVSIMPRIQKVAEDIMANKTGAVVALDPRSGEIKVLVSSPSFNANLFSRGISVEDWTSLIQNKRHPLLNRVIQSQQPPGSVFKIITAIAALEQKKIDPNEKIFCSGKFVFGDRTFSCWKDGGHGFVDLKEAIIESCDNYFYALSLKTGIEAIKQYASLFGLGQKTGIELPGEKRGLVPSPQWKKDHYHAPWQRGETLNTGIGQGYVLTTPLQIACLFGGIATGGTIYKPRLVLEMKEDETVVKTFPKKVFRHITLAPATVAFIKTALTEAVSDAKGTGNKAFITGLPVAGKTGTAQVTSKKEKSADTVKAPWGLRDHAWFAAFAPADDPQLVVCVLIEHGGGGGTAAAPVARAVFKSFFSQQ